VRVSVSLSQFKNQTNLISDMMIGNGLLTFLVMTIALSLMIRFVVSKSLITLSDKMRQVEEGNLDIQLSCTRDDEIGILCRSFVTMVDRLHNSMRQIEETYQRELQHADRLATLGELAAGLAHEIRNPLAGISGAIHVLTEEMDEDDPNNRIMEEMQNEISRLNNTLSRFLSYSKPAEPEFREVDLHQVIDSSLALCMRSDQFSNIKLIKDFQTDLEKIYLDPTLIQQAFINILLNALQILNSDGELTISTRRDHVGQNMLPSVRIEFSDNGPGVPQHIVKDIFKPFFSTRTQGTGLGLAIVKHIILQHNGTIFVENIKEGGARFIITLPFEQDKMKNENDVKS
jgi:signal transduction histidine kinase